MTYSIVPRATIGVPAPTPGRPLLGKNLKYLLTHYTGSPGYSDPTKDLEYAKRVASYGIVANKPYEYNYLIGLGGTIFEQAGSYKAAHCLNFNDKSYGVLLMLGIGVLPSSEMIDAYLWLCAQLEGVGAVDFLYARVPHYRFRSTGCPGATIAQLPGRSWLSPTGEGSLGDLHSEFLAHWMPPAPPTPPSEDDMDYVIFDVNNDVNFFAGWGKKLPSGIYFVPVVHVVSPIQLAAQQAYGVTKPINKSDLKGCALAGPLPEGYVATDFANSGL